MSGNAVELAQVWVPLMPEASKLAAGVEKIGADAERRFGRATKTMGASMAANLDRNAEKATKALKDVERATIAVERAKKRDADATGRLLVAQQRYEDVAANSRATEGRRAAAMEAVARAQRAQEITASGLTRATRALSDAQAAQGRVSAAAGMRGTGLAGFSARVAAQAEAAGANSGRRFVGGFTSMLKGGALLAAGGGFIGAVKSVMDLGVGMESNLNRFQGVTKATATVMAQASSEAQKLGNDTSIVGASAVDASTAMLELAKGGLTAEQSMAAARGTLQLAAAAQIDAGTAAQTQAAALNAFQLNASQATKVADVLAGAANASAGEVGDYGLALAAVGNSAHGFGISLEDTVGTLALFAKTGIQASDTGTVLNTMLTHLAAPTGPAAGAMDELNLNLRDAKGNFVGVTELARQLGEAQKRMRPDDFQRALAKVFGTRGIRGAMALAQQGAGALTDMTSQVSEAGGAARMAASNMQGLPGVIEKIHNAADTAKISVYNLLKPMAEAGGNKVVDWLNKASEVVDRLKSGGGGGALKTIADGWKDISGAVKDIAPDLLNITKELAKGAGATVVTGWRALGTAFKVIEPPVKSLVELLGKVPGLGMGVGALLTTMYLKSKLAGPALGAAAKATQAWTKAFSGWRTEASEADKTMSVIKTRTGETMLVQRGAVTRLRDTYREAAGESRRFARTIGVARTAAGGLAGIGSSIAGVFGGPWGLAITGATMALGYLATSHAKAKQAADDQRAAEKALQDQLDASTGSITEEARATIAKNLQDSGAVTKAQSLGIDPHQLLLAASGDEKALNEIGAKLADLYKQAEAGQGVSKDAVLAVSRALSGQISLWQGATIKQRELNQELNGTWKATDKATDFFKQLGAAVGAVPNGKTIEVTADTDEAKKNIQALKDKGFDVAQDLNNPNLFRITANTDEAKQQLQQFVVQVQTTNPQVKVGADTDAATRVMQDWLAQMQGKDIQLHPTVAPGANPFALPAPAPAGAPPQAPPPGFAPPSWHPPGGATGGRVVGDIIRGPGTGTSDSILAVTNTGRALRVANGESINTEASTRRNYPLIRAMNRGYVPPVGLLNRMAGLPRYAGGGIISIDRTVDELSGAPYVRGGHSFGGVDCSGAASMIVNAALGLPVDGDRMNTADAADWLAAKGFMPGKGPAGTLRIGWYNGGPGGGHMAVTLPDGRPAESGGKHGDFIVGAGAAGADDPEFKQHAYLPVEAMYPDGYPGGGFTSPLGFGAGGGGGFSGGGGGRGGGGGFSSAQAKQDAVISAQNRLARANDRVAETQERLNELEKDSNAKESTKTHAKNQLAKAERDRDLAQRKLAEAQAKPVGGGAGGSGVPGAQGFGQDLLKGALQAAGFDGSVFGDPTQWGIWKLFTGGANYVGGLLKNFNPQAFAARHHLSGAAGVPGSPSAAGVGDGGLGLDFGGGGGGGGVMAGLGGLLQGAESVLHPQAHRPGVTPNAASAPAGDATGPTIHDNSINFHGPVGMSPKEVTSAISEKQNDRVRTYTTGLPVRA